METEAAQMIGAAWLHWLAGVVGIGNVFATTIATIGRNPSIQNRGRPDVDRLRAGRGDRSVCPARGLHGAVRLRLRERRETYDRPQGATQVPQLEVWTFPSQIFWLLITFSTLYYLLSRKALPRVSEILEARQDRIAADLDQAQRLRREAESALATYEQSGQGPGRGS